MNPRQHLRKQLRAARQALHPIAQTNAAQQLIQHLSQHALFEEAQHIACYLSNDSEISPEPLIQHIWHLGKSCYLPALDPLHAKHMYFVRYQAGDPLNKNRYKILEPVPDPKKIRTPQSLDLVLVPVVGFDDQGNRLGMGGGFYDRTFAFLKQPCQLTTPRLVGLAYACQKVENLPHAAWDIPLHAIATENGVQVFPLR